MTLGTTGSQKVGKYKEADHVLLPGRSRYSGSSQCDANDAEARPAKRLTQGVCRG
jgi:hypothetical protein